MNTIVLLLLINTSTLIAAQQPLLSVVPSRTSGTAPLAVLFDATGTKITNADSFREITYTFNYGDPGSGTWITTGMSKNVQVGGPLAAHVYDTAGTYTVSVRASSPSGEYHDMHLNITVIDPTVTFVGAKTVCVSVKGDFTGCPSDALQQASVPEDTAWNGKRWLFRSGETFDTIDIQDGNANVWIGKFGTGPSPIFSGVHVGDWRPNTPAFPNDITIMGLRVNGSGMNVCLGKRVLFYQNNITTNTDGAIGIGFGEPGYWIFEDPYQIVPKSQFYNPREFFFVDNYHRGDPLTVGNIYGSSALTAFMGNDVERNKFHNLRCTKCYKVFFGHNRFGGVSNDGGRHSFKLHSRGLNDSWVYNDNSSISGENWISQYNVVSNNVFSSPEDNNIWVVMVSPQNGEYPERIGDIILENNLWYVHDPNQVDLLMAGRNITYRNNTRVGGSNAVLSFNDHGDALPTNWKGPYFNISTAEIKSPPLSTSGNDNGQSNPVNGVVKPASQNGVPGSTPVSPGTTNNGAVLQGSVVNSIIAAFILITKRM